ncbi:hypothetical protein PYW07_015795 [Mythimna separata]|uniref:Uncharacterized protein n=1 Tax=Mythimna separata TaxID=271217 RepID=A0AAD7YSJ7_MYTSE|nr:hypothetical protein PYW07_015795 [Mythimna separata]
MFSKIIFVLATVCIVNASVLTGSDAHTVPDNSASNIEDSVSSRKCTHQECNAMCHRLKFREGTCIAGRCNCNVFFPIPNADAVPDDSVSNIEDSVSPRKCTHEQCNTLSHKLKFREGVCIAGRCSCNNYFPIPNADAVTNVEDSISPRKCTHEQCNTLCHKLKFREGVCIAGRCSCNNYFPIPNDADGLDESITQDNNFPSDDYLSTEDVDSEDSVSVSELSEDPTKRGCNPQACHQLCRRIKQAGGVCVNGRCRCDHFLGTEDAVDEYSELDRKRCRITKCNRTCTRRGYNGATCVEGRCKCYNTTTTPLPVSELSEDPTKRGCNPQACHQLCRRIKQAGGACVNGRCKCDHFLGTEDAVDEYSELDTRRCRITKCNRTCTRRGYEGATCVEGRCKCYNTTKTPLPISELSEDPSKRGCNPQACHQLCRRIKRSGGACVNGRCKCDIFLGAEVSEESLPVSELSEDPTKRGCNPQACHQLCRRIKRSGGACVNGRCKCDIFLGAEGNAIDEYPEVDTRRVCSKWQCNRTCTRRGYAGARCVNGWCKCHDKIQKEDATPLNNIASDVNEESYDILKNNEEELSPRWSLECNIFKCTEKCYHLKFDLGWCYKGRCECYKN